ncbi:Hypothetical predicted protein, partial [Pelobates cultripes]
LPPPTCRHSPASSALPHFQRIQGAKGAHHFRRLSDRKRRRAPRPSRHAAILSSYPDSSNRPLAPSRLPNRPWGTNAAASPLCRPPLLTGLEDKRVGGSDCLALLPPSDTPSIAVGTEATLHWPAHPPTNQSHVNQ